MVTVEATNSTSSMRDNDLNQKIQNCLRLVERLQRERTDSQYYLPLTITTSMGEIIETREEEFVTDTQGFLEAANSNNSLFAKREWKLERDDREENTFASTKALYGQFIPDADNDADTISPDLVIANPHACSEPNVNSNPHARPPILRKYYADPYRTEETRHQDDFSQSDDCSRTYDNSLDQVSLDENDNTSLISYLDNIQTATTAWITRAPSNEVFSCLCCVPGEEIY